MGIKTFNPKDITIIVGTHTVKDYTNGQFIEIAYEEDAYEHLSSADGEEMRFAKNDNRAVATLTLMQGSDSAQYLNSLRLADKVAGAGVAPFLMKDTRSNDLVVTDACWHKKAPSFARGSSKEDLVFTLSLKDPTMNLEPGAQNAT